MLLCNVGTHLCALPIEHVVETMRPLPIEPVGEAGSRADLVRGVAIVRGVAVPVVDAARLLGAGAVSEQPGRFVTLRVGERCVALAVTAVVGVRQVSASSLHELPPLLRDTGADVVSKIGALDAQLLVVLHTMRLLP